MLEEGGLTAQQIVFVGEYNIMKIIAIGAVTAGGKTTVVNAVKDRLPRTSSLHFDNYSFEGEVEDFSKWVSEGADVHVWDLSPLKTDIDKIVRSGECIPASDDKTLFGLLHIY